MHAFRFAFTLCAMQRRFALSYALLVGLPLILVVGLVAIAQEHFAGKYTDVTASTQHVPAAGSFHVLTLLLQIATILIVARACGMIFRRFGQPQVVGEMAAGIILGPSVLGNFLPAVSNYIFPAASLSYLNSLSQIGLLLFMFLIGLELDFSVLRGSKRVALLISHASIVLPFLLGVLIAVLFFEYAPPTGPVEFVGYALFMGTAMSITAFPVLARIIHERGLTHSRLGAIAIACAAIDDVTAWCILALVVMLVRVGGLGTPLLWTVGGSAVYVALMLLVARPLAARLLAQRAASEVRTSHDLVALLLVFALASAWITEKLGIHALYGAFLAGACMPTQHPLIRDLIRRLEDITVVFLLPLFFAFSGLRTHIEMLDGPERWLKALLIIVAAVAGKLGGSALAARATGMTWKECGAIGALMNTRGLMELVVLNIGLEIGVIPPPLFAMMVLMALVTTLMTTPLLNRYYPRE
jgi:Kef-type K+ transport system membrane component KefB